MTAAIVRCAGILMFVLVCAGVLSESIVWAQPEQSKQYTPISELPPSEQIPAARLLVAAYSFVIVMVFLYVVSVARRLTAVQREVERLEADVKRTGHA